jgi:pimeloyl-ACP methyl ester carboxylesterase
MKTRHLPSPWFVLAVLLLPPSSSGVAANPLDKAQSRFATLKTPAATFKVHYKSLGQGKAALVFIHGWCSDMTVWREQAAAFDGRLPVLFVDLPGYGKSDTPKIDYTMDVLAQGIDAVLRDAGVEQAVLAGHSMGTPVIRQFYRLYPTKTKALVFVDGGLRPFTKDPAETERFMSMFKEETFKDTAPKFLTSMLPESMPAETRRQIEEMVARTDPHVAISSMRSMMDEKLWKQDPIKVPSQALMAKSPFWTDDYKEFVKRLAPGIDYREFDGVGHFLFMERPKEFNDSLIEFLRKQGMLN